MTRDARTVLAELDAFLPVLRLVERQRFHSLWLQSLYAKLADGEAPPTHRAFSAVLDAWETAMRNQFVLPIAFASHDSDAPHYAIER